MTSQIHCPHCGVNNDPTSKFCGNCGANVEVEIQQHPIYPPKQQSIHQPIYSPQPATIIIAQAPPSQSNGAAIASLTTGIIGFVLQWIPFINFFSPIFLLTAFITGIIGATKPTGRGMAITGIILSLSNVVILIILLVFLSALYLPFFY